MLKKRIIPCLDIKDGRIVKGVKFLNLKDAGDPVEAAIRYDRDHADELIFLDITASVENRDIILDVVKKTAEEVFMPLTVGGGIRNLDDIKRLLSSGADKVSLNTAAVTDPDFVNAASNKFGTQCIVVAVDARRSKSKTGSWEVFTHGGRKPTGIDVIFWVKKMESFGAGEILLTSMDRDGTKEGYDLELTRTVSEAANIPVIASGGAGNLDHMVDGITQGKADAVLAASIFHYNEYSILEAKQFMYKKGVEVRL